MAEIAKHRVDVTNKQHQQQQPSYSSSLSALTARKLSFQGGNSSQPLKLNPSAHTDISHNTAIKYSPIK